MEVLLPHKFKQHVLLKQELIMTLIYIKVFLDVKQMKKKLKFTMHYLQKVNMLYLINIQINRFVIYQLILCRI